MSRDRRFVLAALASVGLAPAELATGGYQQIHPSPATRAAGLRCGLVPAEPARALRNLNLRCRLAMPINNTSTSPICLPFPIVAYSQHTREHRHEQPSRWFRHGGYQQSRR